MEKLTPVQRIDYKDLETLKKFLNPHGKIMPRRRTGLTAASQRNLAEAVKRARFMALIPYIVR
jgi:small subunit ribosomal protein S18